MKFQELIEKAGITQAEAAKILNVSNMAISKRMLNPKSEAKVSELQKIEQVLGKPLYNGAPKYDQVQIKYIDIPGVPDEIIKSPRIKERLQFDLEITENEWLRDSQNLRIVKCGSHMMDGGDYPIRINNILIVDISSVDIRKRGVYLYTTHNNERAFIHGLWRKSENIVESYYFNPNYTTTERSVQELDNIGFKVYGRIIKNLSLTI